MAAAKASAKKKTAVKPGAQETDPKALSAAIKAHAKRLAWLKVKEGGLKKEIAAMPDTLGDYYEALERPDMPGEGESDFALSLLVRDVLASPQKTTLKKLKEPSSPTVFYGDLHVEGNMELDDFVIVLGDLTVDGILSDADEYAHLWVTGSLRAKAIECRHSCWVGGKIKTDAVVVGDGGYLGAFEGIAAELAIRDCFNENGFRGTVKAKHFIDTEKNEKGLKVLAEKYLEGEDDSPSLSDAEALLEAVVAGKKVLR